MTHKVKENVKLLNDFIEALPYTKLEYKEYWKEKFEQGIEIAKINKSNFINESA